MRILTGGTQTILDAKLAIQPYNILEVFWNRTALIGTLYSDLTIPGDNSLLGNIISLTSLDDVTTLSQNTSVGSISVLFSDLDGSLKTIYDTIDIHLCVVKVYQAFVGLSSGERFLIFEGQVTSNIVWDEGQRTLGFDVTSKVSDVEVGFSLEDAVVKNLDMSLIGQAWPFVFGTVRYIQPMQLIQQPTAVLLTEFGLPDLGIQTQVWRLRQQMGDVTQQIQILILGNTSGDVGSDIFGDLADTVRGIGGDLSTFDAINEQLREQAERLAQIYQQIQQQIAQIQNQVKDLLEIYHKQEIFFKKNLRLHTLDWPNGPCVVMINNTIFTGVFQRDSLSEGTLFLKLKYQWPGPSIDDIKQMVLKTVPSTGGAEKEGFRFFNIGTTVTLLSDFPIPYIASTIGGQIRGVYAYRSFNGLKKLTKVPDGYYYIPSSHSIPNFSYNTPHSWFNPLAICLNKPLNNVRLAQRISQFNLSKGYTIDQIYGLIDDEQEQQTGNKLETKTVDLDSANQWDNELYLVVESSIGPDIITLMKWIIDNFTDLAYDNISFAQVKSYTDRYEMGFLYQDKKNVIQFLQELAFQIRCALWLKNGVFFIRYLPIEPEPVDTIDESDIETRSIKMLTTSTENLKTRYVGKYQLNYLPSTKESYVISKNNVDKYGLVTENVDFYAFSNHYCVKKSVVYWLLKNSNTWKRISFNAYMHKLNIETMDCITVNIPSIGLSCKGIVESAVYDSENFMVSMVILLPILLGHAIPSKLVWPSAVSIVDNSGDFQTGGTGRTPITDPISITMPNPVNSNSLIKVEEFGDGIFSNNNSSLINPYNNLDIPDSYPFDYVSDIGEGTIASHYIIPPDIPNPADEPDFEYNLKDAVLKELTLPTGGGGFPGKITSQGDDPHKYTVRIYPKGIHDEDSSKEVAATQLQIDDDDFLDEGTWVLVVSVVNKNGSNEYYIQSPVWG